MGNSKKRAHCRPKFLRVTLLLLITLLSSEYSQAFSCFEIPFVKRVTDTPNIFVARITGGRLVKRGNRSEVHATFEVVENLKGRVSFDRLITSADFMSGGIPFVVGGEYLIYASETGNTGMCSNSRALSPVEFRRDDVAERERDALRASATIDFQDLVSPWYFREFGPENGYETCQLMHELQFEGGEYPDGTPAGQFIIRWTGGDVPDEMRPPAWPMINVTISMHVSVDISSYSANVQVGKIAVMARGGPVIMDTPANFFVISNDDARTVLNELLTKPDINIVTNHPKFGRISAYSNATNIGVALDEMLNCVNERT